MSQTSRTMLQLLLILLLAIPALARRVQFGVKGGVPISEYFETGSSYSSATRRYTLGPSIEVRVWNTFSLEFDALYKRIGYSGEASCCFRNPLNTTTDVFDVTGSSWDFPLVVKYRFGQQLPLYVSGGGVLRYIGPVRARGTRTHSFFTCPNGQTSCSSGLVKVTETTPIDSTDPFDLRKRVWPGVTVAAGVEFARGRFRISPEFRYTRITSNIGEPTQRTLRLNQNQTEFLLGFLF